MNFKEYEKNKENCAEAVNEIKIGIDLCKLVKVKLIEQAAFFHQGDALWMQR